MFLQEVLNDKRMEVIITCYKCLCLCLPLLITISSCIHASMMLGSTSLTGLTTTPSQNACSLVCRAAKSKNIFSNEGAGVYNFVFLIAHISENCVQLKMKRKQEKILCKAFNLKNKKRRKNWRKASTHPWKQLEKQEKQSLLCFVEDVQKRHNHSKIHVNEFRKNCIAKWNFL